MLLHLLPYALVDPITVDELPDAQALHINNEFLKPFDIIAATPGNQKVFTYLCETADIGLNHNS